MKVLPKLQQLQKDPVELEKCQKDSVYFYNTYVRQEGEPVLDAEGYKKYVEREKERRKRAEIKFINPLSVAEAVQEQMKIERMRLNSE